MFYKVLFLLAMYNLFKSVKSFIRENAVIKDGQLADFSLGTYISAGVIVMFHIMVMAVCCLPSMLF